MKQLLIVANWKMNKNKLEAKEFFESFLKEVSKSTHEVVIAPSYVLIDYVEQLIKGSKIKLASQNMFYVNSGAFTGEVSPYQLADFNIEYVILGHSERRQYFLEGDEFVNKKVIAAISNNFKPIVCVGETDEQYEAGMSEEIVKEQITMAFQNVDIKDLKNLVIAYEPIWAIGTGKAMDAAQANKMAKFIKDTINSLYNKAVEVKVLYGGSVNENNSKEYFEEEFINGALIGGAGLDPQKLTKIILG